MKLYPSNGGYHCFVCHAHGTVIDLVMGICGCDFKDAVRALDEMYGLKLLENGSRETFERARRAARERQENHRKAQREAAEAQEKLLDAEDRMRKIEFALRDYAPARPNQPVNDAFVAALMQKDQAEAEVESARYAYEQATRAARAV